VREQKGLPPLFRDTELDQSRQVSPFVPVPIQTTETPQARCEPLNIVLAEGHLRLSGAQTCDILKSLSIDTHRVRSLRDIPRDELLEGHLALVAEFPCEPTDKKGSKCISIPQTRDFRGIDDLLHPDKGFAREIGSQITRKRKFAVSRPKPLSDLTSPCPHGLLIPRFGLQIPKNPRAGQRGTRTRRLRGRPTFVRTA